MTMTNDQGVKFVTYGGLSHLKLPGWRGSMCGDYINPKDLQNAQTVETTQPVCAKCQKAFNKNATE